MDAATKKHIIEEYATHPGDTGSPDVQIALLTRRIAELTERVREAGLRVQLARRFHNDAVKEVQRVRAKRVVRWFRLAGHADLPQTVEFDDTVPGR